MTRFLKKYSQFSKIGVVVLGLLSVSMLVLSVQIPQAAAQTQFVSVSPGNINLGMTSTIKVTAPAAGAYTVIVQKPSGAVFKLNETFSSAGQSQNATFGNSTTGFKGVVDQAGTYNVFLEQGTTVVSSSSFYATDKLLVSMDLITGSTCAYIPGGTRGMEMFPRFYVTYASNGGPVTNNDKSVVVTYTLPDSTVSNATWHAPNTRSQSTTGFFIGRFLPSWNYTSVGQWVPTVNVSDAAGNTVSWKYIGSPFTISPVTFSISTLLLDSATNQTITTFQSGQSVNIVANVTYPAPPNGDAAVTGFVGPLDSATRGGSVNALVGWGYYNTTSSTFGGKNPGALISQVTMTYNTKTHLWSGQFNATSLPTLSGGNTYKVVINAKDAASPSNMGSASLSLAPSGSQTTSGSQSSSQSSAASQSSTITEGIPVWAYAATTIALIIGVIVGFIARKK